MKKNNNPYLYAGLTALSVIVLTMLMVFIIFRHKDLAAGLSKVTTILQPVIIGAVLAYMLSPVCNRVEKFLGKYLPQKWYRSKEKKEKAAAGLSVAASALFALLIFFILMILIVPATFNSISDLARSLPGYVKNLMDWLYKQLEAYPNLKKLAMSSIDSLTEKFETFASIIDFTKTNVLPSLPSLLSGLGNGISIVLKGLVNGGIGFIISIYLLSSRRTFARQSKMTLYAVAKPKAADMIYTEVRFADKMFSGFLRGKMVDSAIVGIICFIVLRIMNYSDATLISVIVGVTNIVPVFGPFIGAIPSALLIFAAEPKKCIPFIIFIIILQQLDGNIIGPKCMGSNVNLSAFWTLFAILFFGGLWGFVGMLVGVPLFAVIYDIAKKLVFYNLKRNGKEDMITGLDPSETEGLTPEEIAVFSGEKSSSEKSKKKPNKRSSNEGQPTKG